MHDINTKVLLLLFIPTRIHTIFAMQRIMFRIKTESKGKKNEILFKRRQNETLKKISQS